MIEVRKAIKSFLKSIHPNVTIDGKTISRVFFQQAPEDAIFPYIVYDLPNSFSDGEGGELISLDIDGWDSNITRDTTVIENLMKTINTIDKKTLTTSEIALTLFLDNKIPLLDDDKNIHRRKYIYSGRLLRK